MMTNAWKKVKASKQVFHSQISQDVFYELATNTKFFNCLWHLVVHAELNLTLYD
jgi:hypothetical protein